MHRCASDVLELDVIAMTGKGQYLRRGCGPLVLVAAGSRGSHDRVRGRATVSGQFALAGVDYRFTCESGRLAVASLATAAARPRQARAR
jgi:hypothetical protein